MADQKTRKVLRLNGIESTGAVRTRPITLAVRDSAGEAILNEDGSPAVTITLNPISDEERRQIIAECTTLERDPAGGRGLYEHTNNRAVTDEILRRAILDWDGIAGSDDRPLVCNDTTKVLLDGFLQAQITRKLFNTEAVEVLAESFR